MAEDGEAKVVRGASLLILLQVGSRAVTFVANQVLVRFLTAQLLGIATQLEVYYLSVLFFARESLRVAIQRQGAIASANQKQAKSKKDDNDKGQSDETQAVVNLGYIAIALGWVFAAALGWMYLSSVSTNTIQNTPYFTPSVYIYAIASILELLSEPVFVVMQIRLQFGVRARAESVATVAKCLSTLGSAVWASRRGVQLGVLPFALGQTAYGLGLLTVYVWHGTRQGVSLLPRRLAGKEYFLSWFYRPTVNLASSMMMQSFVKHLLTQGDTFLVSILSTPTAQGVYALANNYGGLAARLVFQPVEESSRNYFSRLLSTANGASAASQPPRPAALQQAAANLTALYRTYTLLSLPLLALGPVAAPLVLSIVAGPQWAASGAGDALAAYVYYIPTLALNGITEAFVASVATEAQVHVQSVWMMGFSAVFAASGYVFLRVLDWGAVGLVVANVINMAGRVLWGLWFIRKYFSARGVQWEIASVLPSPWTVASAAVAAQAVRSVTGSVDSGAFKAVFGELLKVAGVAVPFLGVL